jgi:hypothetical protein
VDWMVLDQDRDGGERCEYSNEFSDSLSCGEFLD